MGNGKNWIPAMLPPLNCNIQFHSTFWLELELDSKNRTNIRPTATGTGYPVNP